MKRRHVLVGVSVALSGCLDAADAATGDTSEDTNDGGSSETPGTPEPEDVVFDQDGVQAAFLERFNEMRDSAGLTPAMTDTILTDMAADHAANMAEYEYIGHVQPDGTTIEDRYRQRGLLPQCELSVPGAREYYPGAENAAGAAIGASVTHPGTDETFAIYNDETLAAFLFDSWMSSPGHREVMELPAVRQIGLGVDRNGTDVYAALTFC